MFNPLKTKINPIRANTLFFNATEQLFFGGAWDVLFVVVKIASTHKYFAWKKYDDSSCYGWWCK